MKKGSDEQPAPKGENGGSSSTRKNVNLMTDYLEHSKQKMKSYLKMVEDRLKSSNTMPIVGLPQAKNIKSGWSVVEVASSFNQKGMLAGGGFLLRGSDKTPILAEAFPLQDESPLFADVCALHKAMEMSIVLVAGLNQKAGEFVFLFESAELARCITERIFPEDYTGPIIDECRNWLRAMEFEFMQVPGEKLAAAKWLAEHGRTSQQHSKFDKEKSPGPPELAELLAQPPLY